MKRWIPRKGETVRLTTPDCEGKVWEGVVEHVTKRFCLAGQVYLTISGYGKTNASKNEIVILA